MRIYFIRHGFSCANLTHSNNKKQYKLPKNIPMYYELPDPILANKGIHESKSMVPVTKKLNHTKVLCSSLNRAIETALHMFPNDTIYIVPYIKEDNNEIDNTSQDINTKIILLKKLYSKDFHRLNFTYINDKNKNYVSLVKFKNFIQNHFENERIAVVTHSLFLINKLGLSFDNFPKNNSIYKTYMTNNHISKLIKINEPRARKNQTLFKNKDYKRCLN